MTNMKGTAFWQGQMPELQGAWFGQAPPGLKAVEFCPRLFDAKHRVAGITFGPEGDEAFFTLNTPDGASSDIMWTRVSEGIWTKPQPAPFNSTEIDNDVCMAPSGKRVVWRSWRPLPGNTKRENDVSLWAIDRTAGGWGEPFPVECGGERQQAVYPGIGLSGTLYFSVQAADGKHMVVRAKRNGQQYEDREIIIPRTSPGGDLCVAPDESFLVITVYNQPEGGTRTGSLHVSFRNPDETWTPLQDLGLAVNAETTEYCPTISADGKWLFFCHLYREDGVVRARARWIDTHAITRLRA